MFKREIVKEITSKGQLKADLKQYLRIVYLPETQEYSQKWSIEIGKILKDNAHTRPISFRSSSPTMLLSIADAIFKCYLSLNGDKSLLKQFLKKWSEQC